MFDAVTIRDARPILWLKRAFVAIIVALLAIGMVSAHRAYFQVRDLELNAPHELTDGSVVETSVVSSGRTTVDVVVELIQGTHTEKLLKLRLKGNELGFFDPRKRYGTDSVTLTPEMLSKFQPGAARLRSVAIGRHQWFRLPPPTVREFDVVIQKQSGG
jgi:hypothetical protein